MLRLIHACEVYQYKGEFDDFILLNSQTSSDDMLCFWHRLANYVLTYEVPLNVQDIIDKMLNEDSWVVSGGLIATDGKFKLTPGCCCGMESWREWGSLKHNGYSPWLGHDPDPGIDLRSENPVLHNGRKDKPESLEVSFAALQYAFAEAEKEFSIFTNNFEIFLNQFSLNNINAFIKMFREEFSVVSQKLPSSDAYEIFGLARTDPTS